MRNSNYVYILEFFISSIVLNLTESTRKQWKKIRKMIPEIGKKIVD